MQVTASVQHTWMTFVDGENLTLRGQDLAEQRGVTLVEGGYFKRDCFVWIPGRNGRHRFGGSEFMQQRPIRATFYTGVTGADALIQEVRQKLKELAFQPQVFKRIRKDAKAKGVDIALTKDMLSHAFRGNYETAVLISGDGDYVPLVEEVQRLGKRVVLWFFEGDSLNRELKLGADDFVDITTFFLDAWKNTPHCPIPR